MFSFPKRVSINSELAREGRVEPSHFSRALMKY